MLKHIFSCFAFSAVIAMSAFAFIPNAQAAEPDATLTPVANSSARNPRLEYNLNRAWKFTLGDFADARNSSFDDSAWNDINLPHSFSMPYFLSDRFYSGYGWYRKVLSVPAEWKGRQVAIDFDGAFQVTEFFVNGKPAGSHRGGYTGFRFDITPYLEYGKANTLAIRVNNIWDPTLAPRSGEHTFSGGIYRNVRLVLMDPVHVDWYGTFVTTPNMSKESAPVNVKTDLVNSGTAAVKAELETAVLDADGKICSQKTDTIDIPAGKTVTAEQNLPAISSPQLWSPETPYLYRLQSTVKISGKVVDRYITNFGCRWIRWDKDTGFYLNGDRRYLRGANMHQDRAGWGDAASDAGFARDIAYMKEVGFDIIRGSHYPHAPAFVNACDTQGMFFWSENCFWGTAYSGQLKHWRSAPAYPENPRDREAFEQSVKDSLRDMIRIHRNSPSIVCWSMCNEVFFTRQQELGLTRDFLKRLVALTHELDPSRLAAVGGVQRGQVDHCGDIAGYNGDGATIQEYLNPGIPSIVSEYGSVVGTRPGNFSAGYDNKITGKREYDWRSGEILWCAIDHGSMAGRFGWMGIMDYWRLPKRGWYWYRENYAGVPHPEWPQNGTPAAVKLTASSNTIAHADGTDDVQLFATIVDANGKEIANSPDVTIRIVSGPGELPTGSTISFSEKSDNTIIEGKCSIDMRAYYAGEIVVEATSPGLKSGRLTVTAKGAPAFSANTPRVTERPYTRYTESDKNADDAAAGVDMAYFKPTSSSSSVDGHSSAQAVDQNPATSWRPAADDANPWFCVSPERFITARIVEIDLESPVSAYRLDCSNNRETWTELVSWSGEPTSKIRANIRRPQEANFYRVSFPNAKNLSVINVSIFTTNVPQSVKLAGEKVTVSGEFADVSGWQTVKFDAPVSGRYLCLEALNEHRNADYASCAELAAIDDKGNLIDSSRWEVVFADSEEVVDKPNEAAKLIDRQESTFWHTQFTGTTFKFPHAVVIDMHENKTLSGFRILNRTDNSTNGRIKAFRFYVKSDPFSF